MELCSLFWQNPSAKPKKAHGGESIFLETQREGLAKLAQKAHRGAQKKLITIATRI